LLTPRARHWPTKLNARRLRSVCTWRRKQPRYAVKRAFWWNDSSL
jgi:hypothetical protein